MRRSKTQDIKEVVNEYLKSMGLDRKMKEMNLVRSWETLLGKSVARSTKKVYIKDGVLYVYVTSAVVRNELIMLRTALIAKLNERAGEKLIHEIVIR